MPSEFVRHRWRNGYLAAPPMMFLRSGCRQSEEAVLLLEGIDKRRDASPSIDWHLYLQAFVMFATKLVSKRYPGARPYQFDLSNSSGAHIPGAAGSIHFPTHDPLTVERNALPLNTYALRFPFEIPSRSASLDNACRLIRGRTDSLCSSSRRCRRCQPCNRMRVVNPWKNGAYGRRPRICASHAGVLRLGPAAACRSLQVDMRGAA